MPVHRAYEVGSQMLYSMHDIPTTRLSQIHNLAKKLADEKIALLKEVAPMLLLPPLPLPLPQYYLQCVSPIPQLPGSDATDDCNATALPPPPMAPMIYWHR